MESYTSMMRRRCEAKSRAEKKKVILRTIVEAVMGIVFFISIFGLGLICTICSGYHWE